MNLAAQLVVALNSTAAPSPQPSTPAGSAAEATPNGTVAEILAALGPYGLVLLFAIAVVGGYVLSLSLHPNAKCARCQGAGKHKGSVYTYATRPCTGCKGRGTNPRLGRRLLFKT